jgi:hypothetical protein
MASSIYLFHPYDAARAVAKEPYGLEHDPRLMKATGANQTSTACTALDDPQRLAYLHEDGHRALRDGVAPSHAARRGALTLPSPVTTRSPPRARTCWLQARSETRAARS